MVYLSYTCLGDGADGLTLMAEWSKSGFSLNMTEKGTIIKTIL